MMDKAIMIFRVKKSIYGVMWAFILILGVCFFSCRGHHKQKTQPMVVESSARSEKDLSRCDLSRVVTINGMNPELLQKFRPLRETDVLVLDNNDEISFRGLAKELCAIGTPVRRSLVIRGEEISFFTASKTKRPIGVDGFWPSWWQRLSELDEWLSSELLFFSTGFCELYSFKTTEGPSLNSVLSSLDPNRCFVDLYTVSPKGSEWGMVYSHLKKIQYLRLRTNADLKGFEELTQLRYLDLEWSYPNPQHSLDSKLAKLNKLETLEVDWITEKPTVSLPQIRNLTFHMMDSELLRYFPNVETVTVNNFLNDTYDSTTKIDTRDFPKTLKYLDLSGNKIEITHWDPKDHRLEVLGLNATRIKNDFDVKKVVEGIKIVEREPIVKLKNRIEFEAGGVVCSALGKPCWKITEKQIRKLLRVLKENYHPYRRGIQCVDAALADDAEVVLKDRRGGNIVLDFIQGKGVFWKGWGVFYPLSHPEGSNRVIEALNAERVGGGKSCKRPDVEEGEDVDVDVETEQK